MLVLNLLLQNGQLFVVLLHIFLSLAIGGDGSYVLNAGLSSVLPLVLLGGFLRFEHVILG